MMLMSLSRRFSRDPKSNGKIYIILEKLSMMKTQLIMIVMTLTMIVLKQNQISVAITAPKQRYCQMITGAMMMKMNSQEILVKKMTMMTLKLGKKDTIVFRTFQIMTRLKTLTPSMQWMRAESLMKHS